MSQHYKVFECGVAEKGWVVFECGVAVKWQVRGGLNGEDICGFEITDVEFEQLQFLSSCGDDMIMHTLHACKISNPTLFRLQEEVAAVWKVPACTVQFAAFEKDHIIQVVQRDHNIKSIDVDLDSRPPKERGWTTISIRYEDLARHMPGWHCTQAYWKVDDSYFDDFDDWYCCWSLHICVKRAVFKQCGYELPTTVIAELSSRDPDPATGEAIVYKTCARDFAIYLDGCRLHSANALSLEFGPFDFKAYIAPIKRKNHLGFSLRLQIVEVKTDEG